MDNAIHGINHYPADSLVCFVNTYPMFFDKGVKIGRFCFTADKLQLQKKRRILVSTKLGVVVLPASYCATLIPSHTELN